MKRVTAEERFWRYVRKTATCWRWSGALFPNGYGVFWAYGKSVRAHRFSYELLIGPIPEGLIIDHVQARGCRHNDCVNPNHLEAVTHQENVLRGKASHRRLICIKGHLLDYSTGRGVCRVCVNARQNKRRLLRRGDRPGASPLAQRMEGALLCDA